MPDKLPEFSDEHDLADWFEEADLSAYDLQPAPEVEIAASVTLTISQNADAGEATSGTTGKIDSKLAVGS